ncbi:hypothetical protein [Pseudopontixanthobacter vadosimaris]|uniref:hypothetical protein n=1 Tax=Pseudopontixanthobacter vadosimaris TaxID=2726450 RepID=UPI001472729C|nr:hypothetical protein [Pseudopontixanthobacter vadosimaris]
MENTSFAERLSSSPQFRALLERTNFPISATIETDADLRDVGLAYISSGQMRSRCFRSIRARDYKVLWLFNDEKDAEQFRDRFGGTDAAEVSLHDWNSAFRATSE